MENISVLLGQYLGKVLEVIPNLPKNLVQHGHEYTPLIPPRGPKEYFPFFLQFMFPPLRLYIARYPSDTYLILMTRTYREPLRAAGVGWLGFILAVVVVGDDP